VITSSEVCAICTRRGAIFQDGHHQLSGSNISGTLQHRMDFFLSNHMFLGSKKCVERFSLHSGNKLKEIQHVQFSGTSRTTQQGVYTLRQQVACCVDLFLSICCVDNCWCGWTLRLQSTSLHRVRKNYPSRCIYVHDHNSVRQYRILIESCVNSATSITANKSLPERLTAASNAALETEIFRHRYSRMNDSAIRRYF